MATEVNFFIKKKRINRKMKICEKIYVKICGGGGLQKIQFLHFLIFRIFIKKYLINLKHKVLPSQKSPFPYP